MSRIALSGNALGTGTFTIASPNSNTDRTLDLPDASLTFAGINVVQSYSAAQRGTVSALGNQSGTITLNMATANNISMTLTGNSTLANPSNQTAGQSGAITITQDATGGRTLAFGSNWGFPGGTAPTLTTAANAVDVLVYYVESSSRITANLVGDVS
jgi:hypothetical protein